MVDIQLISRIMITRLVTQLVRQLTDNFLVKVHAYIPFFGYALRKIFEEANE